MKYQVLDELVRTEADREKAEEMKHLVSEVKVHLHEVFILLCFYCIEGDGRRWEIY